MNSKYTHIITISADTNTYTNSNSININNTNSNNTSSNNNNNRTFTIVVKYLSVPSLDRSFACEFEQRVWRKRSKKGRKKIELHLM